MGSVIATFQQKHKWTTFIKLNIQSANLLCTKECQKLYCTNHSIPIGCVWNYSDSLEIFRLPKWQTLKSWLYSLYTNENIGYFTLLAGHSSLNLLNWENISYTQAGREESNISEKMTKYFSIGFPTINHSSTWWDPRHHKMNVKPNSGPQKWLTGSHILPKNEKETSG